MRRMLRILGWMGLGLSTVLLLGTGVLWARSMGHWEEWRVVEFKWVAGWAEEGLCRERSLRAIHGRLWFRWDAYVGREFNRTLHERRRTDVIAEEFLFEEKFRPRAVRDSSKSEQAWHFAGIGYWSARSAMWGDSGVPGSSLHALAIPFWMLAVVFGLWPVCFAAGRVFRRRRYGAGLCPQCGYDLRATPDRCPECGRAVDAGRGSRENA